MATTLPKRAVRCSVHGLHYDPELTGGCIRCRREGLLPREKPRFVPLLLSLLALTLVGARLVTAIIEERRAGLPVDLEPPTTFGTADPRLDPDPYREPITRIEEALFPRAATDLRTLAGRAAQGGHDLAARIRADGSDTSVDDIVAFARDLAGAELDTHGLRQARDRWFEVRARTFLDAPWLASGVPTSGTDPALVSAYLDLADAIDLVVGEGEQAGIDEGWSARLSDLEGRMAEAPPFDADSNLVLGFGRLQAALAAARRAAGDRRGADRWLREAGEHLTAGRSHLTDLLS